MKELAMETAGSSISGRVKSRYKDTEVGKCCVCEE
jgi:hypothetical protein